ncbi:SDR family NAD(P)-dependent oxidoreductase [Pseudohalioglobus sediminis]|uniref:SDR family NAD(P)-dependent oxidoreductase n=1 Tax=Pseudohalioglobus sediminis TaxID=2606449 RepID=A0A5B0WZX1_9GAMM|nr:SDR family NAD(P)-dependent oxidoreductase [Pseudohalioglobus sediminis]KAA1191888.1 SDR family NAD(P)-dependent oxidoreductase [Pseudohalioglobus sediminis]
MDKTITLDETIEVKRPLSEVFAYVSEFNRIDEWDPGVAKGTKLSEGTTGIGTRFRIDMKAGFSLQYTMIGFEPEQRLLMDVDSKIFTAREEITFKAIRGGTRVRYVARFKFPRPLVAAHQLYPAAMDKVGKDTMKGLKRALEDRFDAPEASPKLAVADKLILPGIWRFTRLGYSEAKRRWNPVSAYQHDRHAVITGATSGVGLAAARELAALGAALTLVARDRDKAEAVAAEISAETGNENIAVEVADMSLMADVHALVDRLLRAGRPVDMLINIAGALFNPRQQTPEGLEKSFALLLLAPYILTEGLRPALAAAESPRVVNVLSGGMYSQKIRVRDLQSQRGRYSGSVAYARAKRGLMILTEEWASDWADDGIVVNAMHPGWADTPGVETALPAFYKLTRPLLRSPEQGADTAVWLAAATEAGQVSGKFWLDREQHPSHVTERTVESPADRDELLATLAELRASTRPARKRGRPRKAAVKARKAGR